MADVLTGLTFTPADPAAAPTPQQLAARHVAETAAILTGGVRELLVDLVQRRTVFYKAFWLNPNPNCTPPALAAALGAQAASLFAHDAALVQFIQQRAAAAGLTIDPAVLPGLPAAWQVAFNGDGLVTITPAPAQ